MHGQDRDEAVARAKRALDEFVIEGIATTIPFHKRVLDNEVFLAVDATTDFIETQMGRRTMTDQMNVEGLSIAPSWVMETIISVAASEVDGVPSLGSFATSGIRSMLASKPSTSGIETKMDEDGKLSVAVHVEVYYGYVLPELAAQLRTAIAEALPPRLVWRCPPGGRVHRRPSVQGVGGARYGPRIHERTRDRVSAVQVLYTSELTGKSPSELLDCGLCLVAREAPADEAEAAEAGAFGRIEEGTLTDYALALIHGVEANQAQVDERIEAASENWALSRMPIVDRSILRLAVFEMFNCDDVPVSVSINEAVELAKGFGGEDDSPRFVNGVLGRIARSMEGDGTSAVRVAEANRCRHRRPVDALVGASGRGRLRAGGSVGAMADEQGRTFEERARAPFRDR